MDPSNTDPWFDWIEERRKKPARHSRIARFVSAARSGGLHANAHVPGKIRRIYFNDVWPLETDTVGGHRSWVEWADPSVADEVVEDDADLALGARLHVTTCRPIPVYHATADEKRRQRMRKKRIMHFVARGLAKAGLYKGVIPEDPEKMNATQLTLSRPMTGVSSRE